MTCKTDNNSKKFLENGWIILDFIKGSESIVFNYKEKMFEWIRSNFIPNLESLEEYHLHVEEDKRHIEIQDALTKYYRDSDFGPSIIHENLQFFKSFLGLDLHVQQYPYLRIARPGKPQDNIGIHRDTHYGSSPYELSISIPFTNTGVKGSLGVISGTHLLSEEALPVTQLVSTDVEKGSTKHNLGFLYAPKFMSDKVRGDIKPVPVKVGQALVFSLSLVHGQEINHSDITRFQSDIRVVNSFAPIQWERSVHNDYYKPLCISAVTEQARIYINSNNKII